MTNVTYSNDALSAKSIFYNKPFSVYVEGKDDILFWSYVFEISGLKPHIEEAVGRDGIYGYINEIVNNGAKYIVACDNDHNDFTNKRPEHKNIISTYGYSIENSMYNPININDVISKLSKKSLDLSPLINAWIEKFCNEAIHLLKYDIANHKYNKGVSICGDTCYRFLSTPSSHKLSEDSINNYLKDLANNFDQNEINECDELIKGGNKDVWFLIKGHFLTNAVINFIKNTVFKMSGISLKYLSSDILYSLTIDIKPKWEEKNDIVHLVEKIKKIQI